MFNIFKKVLKRTNDAIKDIIPTKQQRITKDEFEEILLESDVNYELIEHIMEKLPSKIDRDRAREALLDIFSGEVTQKVTIGGDRRPFIEMVIGVNGAGKTTTIAKLARVYQREGRAVLTWVLEIHLELPL